MMRLRTVVGMSLVGLCAALPVRAEPIPEPIVKMIEAAAKSGKAAELDAVADVARKTYPASTAEINALIASLHATAEAEHKAVLETQTFFEGWKGEGELGASRETGNSNDVNVAVGLHLHKDGLEWAHKFNATADYQRTDGVTGTEQFLVGYEPDYKFNDSLYAFGLAQWERDRVDGYYSRVTEGFGVGYNILHSDKFKWDVTAGPAFRQVHLVEGFWEHDTEARLGSEFTWNISKSTVFTQTTDFYVAGADDTIDSTTAITTKILDALAARFSFDVKKEHNPEPGFNKTDTISRMTLVYGF